MLQFALKSNRFAKKSYTNCSKSLCVSLINLSKYHAKLILYNVSNRTDLQWACISEVTIKSMHYDMNYVVLFLLTFDKVIYQFCMIVIKFCSLLAEFKYLLIIKLDELFDITSVFRITIFKIQNFTEIDSSLQYFKIMKYYFTSNISSGVLKINLFRIAYSGHELLICTSHSGIKLRTCKLNPSQKRLTIIQLVGIRPIRKYFIVRVSLGCINNIEIISASSLARSLASAKFIRSARWEPSVARLHLLSDRGFQNVVIH